MTQVQPAVVQPGTSKLGPNRALEAYLRGFDRAVDSRQVQPRLLMYMATALGYAAREWAGSVKITLTICV